MTLSSLTAALLFTAAAQLPASPPPPPPGTPPPTAAPAPVATAAPVARIMDPAALALVKKMCDRLQAARNFSFQARTVIELPVPGNALATFVNAGSVTVRRPDGLAANRSGDLPDFRFAYDGTSVAVFAPASGKWGTAPAPPTLDAMLVDVAERHDLVMPWDELLVADPYAAVSKGVEQAIHVSVAKIDGQKVDHVLLTSPGLQLEYWIDAATALPARSVVVYTDDPRRPHFAVDFSGWKLDQKLPASTFALPKPSGARTVDVREASSDFR